MDEKTKEKLKGFFDNLTGEQKEKAKACETSEEFMKEKAKTCKNMDELL